MVKVPAHSVYIVPQAEALSRVNGTDATYRQVGRFSDVQHVFSFRYPTDFFPYHYCFNTRGRRKVFRVSEPSYIAGLFLPSRSWSCWNGNGPSHKRTLGGETTNQNFISVVLRFARKSGRKGIKKKQCVKFVECYTVVPIFIFKLLKFDSL